MNEVTPEEKKNKHLFEEMPIRNAIATMAIPTIIAQLIVLIYNMADTFFIGRTGDPSMVAAASLILPLYNLSIAISGISSTGGGTLISRLLGIGETARARQVASFSFWFSLCGGVLFALITAIFIHPLLRLLGAGEGTYLFARRYAFCVIVLGGTPTVLGMTLSNLLRSVGCSRESGFGVSMGGILNIILDPLFMFVLLPRGNEILGAGIATAVSNYVVCLYFFLTIRRLNSSVLRFSPQHALPCAEDLRSFFNVGLPAAVGPFLFDLDYIVIDRLMSSYGDISLAAIGIVLKVERFPLNIGIGLCQGMVPLVAYNYSNGNLPRMDGFLRFTRNTGIVISLISIALYELFAPQIMTVFMAEPVTVALGARFLRIRELATIMMFLSFIYVYLFQAVGRGNTALFLAVFRWLMVNIPMLFLLNALFGMYGVVWSQLASDCLVAVVSWLVYRRFQKSHNVM